MLSSRTIACTFTCIALAVPASAAAQPQDLRSPDTRDAAQGAVHYQDLRSPDTRDIGRPVTPAPAPPVAVSNPGPVVDGPGVDWTLIVLAVGGYLLAVALVASQAIQRRRRFTVS